MKKKESIFWCVIIAVCCSCFETQGSDYSFDETGITRDNLENYLGRAVTMAEFLTVDPFCNDATYPDKERDIELIQNIGAKFIGRSIYRWGGEKAFNNPEFLGNAEAIAARVHENDPEVVFQAALFEAVSTDVNHIKVPSWVFEEFGLPIEERNFRYEDMLNLEGKYVGFWGEKTSVPDITRVEARLWFMFLAGTYINIGCEALHLGQIALIGMEDDGYEKWSETLDKIRGFAQKNARRNWVLLDAHTPWGGMVVDGKSLLDFNSFPLRIKEVVEDPFRSVLERGYIDAFYCRSEGGITPSGWYADALPYLVEFDNFGISDTPGQATIDSHYVWGYDEITWFYLQDEAYQKEWLHYAYGWLKENDTNGFLQMPVCRIVVLENEPVRKCHANTRTADFPHGMNLEETIKAIWNSSSEESARAPILNWQIGYHEHETEQPAEWFSARVPGAVQLGIMVWQEFPLACNNYTDHESYLEVLEQEARSIVKRVKKHPCLAIWSGGNELFNSWSGMTDQSLALRLLNSICYQLDPSTPFIYTSPIYGIGHGHYLFHDKQSKEDVFQWMARAKNTAYTEFAVPGVANLEVLKHFIPEEELFPPRRGTAWESHHAFGAWQQDSWLEMPTLKKYFGEIETLEELVAYSQLLQSEGLKFIYEEARRQQPYCSMALNWCYQEPWPTAANNSLINWPNEIKPAFYHVANACRPVLASARMPKFDWSAGEMFTCDLFMLNDSYQEVDGATVEVVMKYDDKQILLTRWECPTIGAFQNQQGPLVTMEIPEMEWDLFTILVRVVGKPQYDSAYVLLYAGNEEHAGDAGDAVKKHLPSRAYYNGETTFIFQ